jgi:hypothetical protein
MARVQDGYVSPVSHVSFLTSLKPSVNILSVAFAGLPVNCTSRFNGSAPFCTGHGYMTMSSILISPAKTAVGVAEGLEVMVIVRVGLFTAVAVRVAVFIGVFVAVETGVAVRVDVAVLVAVFKAVLVDVSKGVFVSVPCGVFEGETINVAVCV